VPLQSSYTLEFCGDGRWCCCFDNLGMSCNKVECCARTFTLSRGVGMVLRQFDNMDRPIDDGRELNDSDSQPETQGPDEDDGWQGMVRGMRLIPIVVSGLLGSLLLATIVALCFSCTQNRRLRRQVDTLQGLNANHVKSYSTPTILSARPSTSVPRLNIYPQEEGRISSSDAAYHTLRTPTVYHPQPATQPVTPASATVGPGFGFSAPTPTSRRPSLPWEAANSNTESVDMNHQPVGPREEPAPALPPTELASEKHPRY